MKMMAFFMSFFLGGLAIAAEKMEVVLTGAFRAVTEHMIGTGVERNAFVYSVSGATQLTDHAGRNWSFSIDCLGFDEAGSSRETTGIGRCNWTDANGDKLYVSLQTEGESNRYKINGGTGKWIGSIGEIVSHFEYLPAPSSEIYLGIDRGKGYLSGPTSDNSNGTAP